jgi:hypothetical protein
MMSVLGKMFDEPVFLRRGRRGGLPADVGVAAEPGELLGAVPTGSLPPSLSAWDAATPAVFLRRGRV